MMRRVAVLAGLAAVWMTSSAQVITFNAPSPWLTARENAVVARVLIDTAKVKKSNLQLALVKVENGKKQTIVSRSFAVKDYVQDFDLGAVKTDVLGGKNFLRLEWSFSGSTEKGACEPFGIVRLDTVNLDTTVTALFVDGTLDIAAAKKAVGDRVSAVGTGRFAAVWTRQALGILCSKKTAVQSLTFTLDGKNGKNAFLAYADRFITWTAGADSVAAYHYQRTLQNEGVVYTESTWIHDITVVGDGDDVLIVIPWHDTGMIPFTGRMIGFSAYAADSATKAAALPAKAEREIPGTWGNCLLTGGDVVQRNN